MPSVELAASAFVPKTQKRKTKNSYKAISLFCGCGGMDLGFEGGFRIYGQDYEKNPFKTVYANDINKYALKTFETNFKIKPHLGDITTVEESSFPEVDVVLGGFPCQTFSHAGKREGLNSPRGQLYKQMKRVVETVKPKIFIAENVDGIRTSRASVDDTALNLIVREFQEIGYDVTYKVLKAVDYGVPQTRVRVIIIGVDSRYSLPAILYPAPTHGEGLLPYRTAFDTIDDLWEAYNEETVPQHGKAYTSQAKFYPGRRMQGNVCISGDAPSPTIRAEHHGNIEGHYRTVDGKPLAADYSNARRLSVRECARIQSFPDSFFFPVSAAQAYKQIGNAVPPVLAWHIAQGTATMLEQIQK